MFRENAVLAEHVDSMTEAQIELLIEATKALNSPFELKFLTSLYIHRLAKNGIFIARKFMLSLPQLLCLCPVLKLNCRNKARSYSVKHHK